VPAAEVGVAVGMVGALFTTTAQLSPYAAVSALSPTGHSTVAATSPSPLAAGLSVSGHASGLSPPPTDAPPPTDDIGDAIAAAAASTITPLAAGISPPAVDDGTCWIGARRIGGGMTIGSDPSNR